MSKLSSKAIIGLLSLAISAFAIGTTEFVIVGLLQTVATDLDISVTKAGTLISVYAAAIAIGTPIVTTMTGKLPKKGLLLTFMTIFIIGNVLSGLSETYELLMISRIITAVSHGVFFAIAATVAAELVPKDKQASAISIMFTGLTVATIIGVPFGTFVGQAVGWRATFYSVAVLGFIGLIANMWAVDRIKRPAESPTLIDVGRLVSNPRILLALLMTAFGFGGTFALFTYLSPILEDVSGFSEGAISWMLLLYGIAVAIGNIIGGKVSNNHPVKVLRFVFFIQVFVLLLQVLLLPHKALSYLSVFILGLFAFMLTPGVQSYILMLAEKLVPKAKDVASAMNISAFNIGIAGGSAIGGFVVETMDYLDTAWIGGIMVSIALLLSVINYRLDRKQNLF
ncbi:MULTISPECIES: MFS transporter [Pontibacillus]|uniref:MFS transporter n=1 Tax=Pontibacillus chungwhensis TaxID=265426 RepID=A0ABY8USS3_9BACI|nr:MFS transporter [Pontibacillus chungwhensis]MCD5323341.1 MFS transporter [Pontibacillus sp. HN14]WIF96722.1 MFS transporter [Pontibacillus chungwhensis]